jgi:hypothetical protein
VDEVCAFYAMFGRRGLRGHNSRRLSWLAEVPAIREFSPMPRTQVVDGRDKPGHDELGFCE